MYYIFSFFHFPYVTWDGSAVGIKFVFKRFDMVIMPLFFELSFSQSKIYFFSVTGCCCTFVYHTFPSAITIEGTLCLNSTITLESLLCFFLSNLFVMPFDYLWHVLGTAIAYFNRFCAICLNEGSVFLSNSRIFLSRWSIHLSWMVC